MAGIVDDIAYHLGNMSASISFYMVHGGTNFGFQNGAMWQNRTTVFTSSYDYSAPLDEAGRTTALYQSMRDAILPFVPDGSVPEPPENLPLASIPEFTLCPALSLFDAQALGGRAAASEDAPLTMEELGQSYGFILYEHVVTSGAGNDSGVIAGSLAAGDRPRDRMLAYVNGRVADAVADSQYQHPRAATVALRAGDRLRLLVENLGRVDYYSRGNPYRNELRDPWKGVRGDVTVGGQPLRGWDVYSLPLDALPAGLACAAGASDATSSAGEDDAPMFYRGEFTGPPMTHNSSMTLDTYLVVPNGVKGNVWVNGFHLGRYWLVGPQQSLYLPGSVVKPGETNEVVILELEPWQMNSTTMVAYGTSERFWGNNPDPDCLDCI